MKKTLNFENGCPQRFVKNDFLAGLVNHWNQSGKKDSQNGISLLLVTESPYLVSKIDGGCRCSFSTGHRSISYHLIKDDSLYSNILI